MTYIISIQIATYNSGKTLTVSLDSIVQQSFKNVEVLITDGFSQYDTPAIANCYKD
jgi:glycosyltransferase involved in cell wall biosynthesis